MSSNLYEKMHLDFPGLPKIVMVPQGASALGNAVVHRLCFSDSGGYVEREENLRSRQGEFRRPEQCYGPGRIPDYSGPNIMGRVEKLDHALDLYAGADISRVLGRELIKLLVAKRLAEAEWISPGIKSNLDTLTAQAWHATMQ